MRLVVGGAVVRAGRVLAARRTEPPRLAGGWEFPGGKIEDGETADAALLRELAEELGITVRLGGWFTAQVDVGGGWVLRVAWCETDEDPVAGEHDELRWLAAEELHEVSWLPGDEPFLTEVRALLLRR